MANKQPMSMQRGQRVLRHSMAGAFLGWLSTYIVYTVIVMVYWKGDVPGSGNVPGSENLHWGSFPEWLLVCVVLAGLSSFLVTLTGWIFLGIPIAATITDRQARSFKFMITVHTIATLLAGAVLYVLSWLFSSSPLVRSVGELLGVLFNLLAVWAIAIGVIGGAVFCALERRS